MDKKEPVNTTFIRPSGWNIYELEKGYMGI